MTETSILKKPVFLIGAAIGIAALSVPLFFLDDSSDQTSVRDDGAVIEAHAGLEMAQASNPGPTTVPDIVQFNRDVRPILSDNCFVCHGNDKGSRKADLQISTWEGATASRKNNVIPLIPGDGENSEIYKRLTHHNPEDRMPPTSTGKSLSNIEIAIVKKWIDNGGEYERHWSYNAPVRAELPEAGDMWAKNAIDQFVAGKHLENGLIPAEEADKRTLIRRVTLDLTGLPPTPEKVHAFLNDESDNAYERMVDDLMNDVHFGERMALNWLDVVRYADTWGYHSDNERMVWPYRDYVINSFNDNKPFDEFTREQLAGDFLPEGGQAALVASTYNHMNKITQEGGAQDQEYRMKYLIDRVSAIGTAWLGSTTACAQCHDHKFDPITAKDFYSMGAFFADIEEKGFWGSSRIGSEMFDVFPIAFVGSEENQKKYNELLDDSKIKKAALSSNEDAKPLPGIETWLDKLKESAPENGSAWKPLIITELKTNDHPSAEVEGGEVIRSSWDVPAVPGDLLIKGTGEFPAVITTIQLELLSKEEDTPRPADLTENVWLAFHDVTVRVRHKDGTFEQTRLDFHSRANKVEAPSYAYYRLLREKLVPYKEYERRIGNRSELQGDKIGLHLLEPLNWKDGDQLEIEMDLAWDDGIEGSEVAALPSTRIKVTGLPGGGPDPDGIAAIARKGSGQSEEDKAEVRKYYQTFSEQAIALGHADYEAEYALMEYSDIGARTWVTTRMEEPRMTKILPLGDWTNDNGMVVEPAVPEFLGKIETDGRRATRLDLANWLVSNENPLTSRVTVNRFWKQFFGSGLSNILNDLGSQGEWPTHPELLDWLAVEFIESGWDMKHMVRLMVTSATYRQSSFVDQNVRDQDPLNRYYARQSQIRLPAEIIRDNALAIADLLVPKVGGRSVRPYQPEGYLSDLAFPRRIWQTDAGEDQYRRGLYTFWQRTRLHPAMMAFDAPTREDAVADRAASNTPLQALVLLNNPSFVEAARAFGENIMNGSGDVDEKLIWAFEKAMARPTLNDKELEMARDIYQTSLEYFNENDEEADHMLEVGLKPVSEGVNKAELAAWTSVARVIINMHETVTRF